MRKEDFDTAAARRDRIIYQEEEGVAVIQEGKPALERDNGTLRGIDPEGGLTRCERLGDAAARHTIEMHRGGSVLTIARELAGNASIDAHAVIEAVMRRVSGLERLEILEATATALRTRGREKMANTIEANALTRGLSAARDHELAKRRDAQRGRDVGIEHLRETVETGTATRTVAEAIRDLVSGAVEPAGTDKRPGPWPVLRPGMTLESSGIQDYAVPAGIGSSHMLAERCERTDAGRIELRGRRLSANEAGRINQGLMNGARERAERRRRLERLLEPTRHGRVLPRAKREIEAARTLRADGATERWWVLPKGELARTVSVEGWPHETHCTADPIPASWIAKGLGICADGVPPPASTPNDDAPTTD